MSILQPIKFKLLMLLSGLAALSGLGSSIYSAVQTARANNEADAIADAAHADTTRVLRSNLRKDYTRRSDFQAVLERMRQLGDEQYQRERGVNAVIGGNENGVYAQKMANAQQTADVMSNMAAQASSYKDSQEQQLLAENANYAAQKANRSYQRGVNTANAMSSLSKGIAGLAASDTGTLGDDLAMFGLTDGLQFNETTGHWYKKGKA